MFLLHVITFVVLVCVACVPSILAATCEETETSHVKLDLAKESIRNAKLLYPKCEDKTNGSNCTVKDRSLAHLNAALDLISEAKLACSCPETKIIEPETNVTEPEPQLRAMDCTELHEQGFNKSGVYKVWPKRHHVHSIESIEVYCDMETDGGGWTVLQRRGDFGNQTNFDQDWETYKNGFGNLTEDFWLGNEKMFLLTKQSRYSARFDLQYVNGERVYASYSSFSIGDEDSGYALHVGQYSGTAKNGLAETNGCKFSTRDRQNDGRSIGNSCIKTNSRSAFWYRSGCGYVNLNGIYQPGVKSESNIWWFLWKNNYECPHSVDMKIRRTNA